MLILEQVAMTSILVGLVLQINKEFKGRIWYKSIRLFFLEKKLDSSNLYDTMYLES